mgnify:CR=1 FL=1
MLDLNRIPDGKWYGVICDTEQELRDFIEAVKFQRCDIDIGLFNDPRKMSNSRYHGKAYFLNYLGSKRLQHGTPERFIKIFGAHFNRELDHAVLQFFNTYTHCYLNLHKVLHKYIAL